MVISSYLRDRIPFVYHDGNKSKNLLISRDVSHSRFSILVILLYLIYSNDLPFKSKFCNVKMYADDVQL